MLFFSCHNEPSFGFYTIIGRNGDSVVSGYIGDDLLQKTITTNLLEKKRETMVLHHSIMWKVAMMPLFLKNFI